MGGIFIWTKRKNKEKDRGIVDISRESRQENVSSQGTDESGKVKVDWLYCWHIFGVKYLWLLKCNSAGIMILFVIG